MFKASGAINNGNLEANIGLYTDQYQAKRGLLLEWIGSSRSPRAAGLILVGLSGITSSTSGALVKSLTKEATFLQVTFWRTMLNTIFLGFWLFANNELESLYYLKRRTMLLVLSRGLFSFCSMFLAFAVYQNIPLGDATAIFSTSVIFTGLLGILILNEAWHLPEVFLAVLCWLGTMFISEPSFLGTGDLPTPELNPASIRHRRRYTLLALMCAASTSTSWILARKISHQINVICFMFITAFVCAVFSFIVMIQVEGIKIPSIQSCLVLVMVALTGIFGQWMLNRGLQLEKAAPAVIMRNSGVLCSFFFQVVFFHEMPSSSSLFGAFLILLSTSLIGIRRLVVKNTD